MLDDFTITETHMMSSVHDYSFFIQKRLDEDKIKFSITIRGTLPEDCNDIVSNRNTKAVFFEKAKREIVVDLKKSNRKISKSLHSCCYEYEGSIQVYQEKTHENNSLDNLGQTEGEYKHESINVQMEEPSDVVSENQSLSSSAKQMKNGSRKKIPFNLVLSPGQEKSRFVRKTTLLIKAIFLLYLVISPIILIVLYGTKMNESTERKSDKESIPSYTKLSISFATFRKGTNGFIPWKLKPESTNNFFSLEENGTIIRIHQSGYYSVSGYLNVCNRGHIIESVTIYLIASPRLREMFPEKILPGTRRSIPVGSDFYFRKEDALTVKVKGSKSIYQSTNASHFTIRRFH